MMQNILSISINNLYINQAIFHILNLLKQKSFFDPAILPREREIFFQKVFYEKIYFINFSFTILFIIRIIV